MRMRAYVSISRRHNLPEHGRQRSSVLSQKLRGKQRDMSIRGMSFKFRREIAGICGSTPAA